MMTHKDLLKQAPCTLGVKSEVLIEGETILIVIDHLQPLPVCHVRHSASARRSE